MNYNAITIKTRASSKNFQFKMASLINLSSQNITPNGLNNTLRFNINNSSVNFKNCEVALAGLTMYNSQFNVDLANYANDRFSIIMPVGASTQLISIIMPSGYYNVQSINQFIQKQMIDNGTYLIDINGNYIFYIRLSENPTYYSVQIDMDPVPSTLPTGWSLPASGLWSGGLPSGTRVPRITIQSNMNKLIGFNNGTYPSAVQTTSQSFLSNFTPQINPTSCYLLRCNLVNNAYTSIPDVMYSFSVGSTTIGELVEVKPNELSWLDVADGSRSFVEVVICDQDGNAVQLRDPQINVQLLLREKKIVKVD